MGNKKSCFKEETPYIRYVFFEDLEPLITIHYISTNKEFSVIVNNGLKKSTIWSYSEDSEEDFIEYIEYLIYAKITNNNLIASNTHAEQLTILIDSNIGFSEISYDIMDISEITKKLITFLKNITTVSSVV